LKVESFGCTDCNTCSFATIQACSKKCIERKCYWDVCFENKIVFGKDSCSNCGRGFFFDASFKLLSYPSFSRVVRVVMVLQRWKRRAVAVAYEPGVGIGFLRSMLSAEPANKRWKEAIQAHERKTEEERLKKQSVTLARKQSKRQQKQNRLSKREKRKQIIIKLIYDLDSFAWDRSLFISSPSNWNFFPFPLFYFIYTGKCFQKRRS